jgi:hypothetical protein
LGLVLDLDPEDGNTKHTAVTITLSTVPTPPVAKGMEKVYSNFRMTATQNTRGRMRKHLHENNVHDLRAPASSPILCAMPVELFLGGF